MADAQVRSERDGAVVTLFIDRPAALNALDHAVLVELDAALDAAAGDGSLRALVITGAGDKAFVAGADIAAMETMSAAEAKQFALLGQGVFRKIELLPQPVIAAVNGFALGGGLELALACDLIFAAANARFGQPEINLGIVPGFGGSQRLPRRVGVARAREIIYSGDMIDAEEALRIGLANRVTAAGQVLDEARRLAAKLAGKAPLAMRQAKAAIGAGGDLDLDNGCRYESEAFGLCFASADRREGMRAFLEKRKAEFSGK
jgi:enoyl-CoA hydratase